MIWRVVNSAWALQFNYQDSRHTARQANPMQTKARLSSLTFVYVVVYVRMCYNTTFLLRSSDLGGVALAWAMNCEDFEKQRINYRAAKFLLA